MGAAVFAIGCGGETTDISAAVEDTNKDLQQLGVTIDCPDTVDGGTGTEFECTLKGGETGTEKTIKLKTGEDSIEPISQEEYEAAVNEVAGG
jgi:hypothetical protein